jgi:hypothetical protein
MEWLKDKKNQPIVAGIGILILVLAIVAVLFETGVIGGSAQTPPLTPIATSGYPGGTYPGAPPNSGYPGGPSMTAGYPGGTGGMRSPYPGMPGAPGAMYPGMPGAPGSMYPGMPGAPGQMGVAAAGVPGALTGKLSAGKPAADVSKGLDPFNVPVKLGVNVPKPVRVAVNSMIPFEEIVKLKPSGTTQEPLTPGHVPNILITPQESATMRVSGVVQTSTGVHAVLEASGRSQDVQPGDSVAGGKVVSIQSDGLMLRGDDGTLVHVPLGSFPTGGGGGGYPSGGYPPGGGYPGGGYPPPGGGFPPGGNYPGGPPSSGGGPAGVAG